MLRGLYTLTDRNTDYSQPSVSFWDSSAYASLVICCQPHIRSALSRRFDLFPICTSPANSRSVFHFGAVPVVPSVSSPGKLPIILQGSGPPLPGSLLSRPQSHKVLNASIGLSFNHGFHLNVLVGCDSKGKVRPCLAWLCTLSEDYAQSRCSM